MFWPQLARLLSDIIMMESLWLIQAGDRNLNGETRSTSGVVFFFMYSRPVWKANTGSYARWSRLLRWRSKLERFICSLAHAAKVVDEAIVITQTAFWVSKG